MSLLNAIKKMPESLAKLGKPAAVALGLVAASTSLAEATTLIYAFTNGTCYRAPITLGRDKSYSFTVGNTPIRGHIDASYGRRSWEDAFNVVANVTAAFLVEGRAHGVTGTYANMHGCDGSWAEFCGTVAATAKEGSLPSNYLSLVRNQQCVPSGSVRIMFERIVNHETAESLGMVGTPVTTRQVPVTPVQTTTPQVINRQTGVTQTCAVGNDGCVHVELKFDF